MKGNLPLIRQGVIESQLRLLTPEEYDGIKAVVSHELATFAREHIRSSNQYLDYEDFEWFFVNMTKGKGKLKEKMKAKNFGGLPYYISRMDDVKYGIVTKIVIVSLRITLIYRENLLSYKDQGRDQWFCSVRVSRGKHNVLENKVYLEEPNTVKESNSIEESDVELDNVDADSVDN